ncbi:MAG: hypothetical protein Q8P39_03615, partial [Candidatus Yanofskybacteria bacterium]|nr:hypothetical protein [Candidatus Yanofskybacteria bacterium]
RESSEETLRREIEEEMSFTPTGYTFLARYEFERSIKDIFFLEADDSFEDRVTTQEGEYGRYFTQEEVAAEPKLIEKDKMVLRDLYRVLGAPHSI